MGVKELAIDVGRKLVACGGGVKKFAIDINYDYLPCNLQLFNTFL